MSTTSWINFEVWTQGQQNWSRPTTARTTEAWALPVEAAECQWETEASQSAWAARQERKWNSSTAWSQTRLKTRLPAAVRMTAGTAVPKCYLIANKVCCFNNTHLQFNLFKHVVEPQQWPFLCSICMTAVERLAPTSYCQSWLADSIK